MSYYLNNQFRNGLSVSQAVADEILNTYSGGFPIGRWGNTTYQRGHAVLMNILRDKMEYSFENGTVVTPNLINLCEYDERFQSEMNERWVITYCDVKYYKTRGRRLLKNAKIEERWTAFDLQDLRKHRHWRSPEVKSYPVLIAQYPKLMNEHFERHGSDGFELSDDACLTLEKDEFGNLYFDELLEPSDDYPHEYLEEY